jgi:hypothetical protein
MMPFPTAGQFKAWVCGPLLATIARSNPAGLRLSHEYFVLQGTGLCDGTITHPEEFYRVWCVCLTSKPRKGGLGPLELPGHEKRGDNAFLYDTNLPLEKYPVVPALSTTSFHSK